MKPSPPKKPRAEAALKRDPDAHALGRTQEGILLADHRASVLAQVKRHDAAGIRRSERDLLTSLALVCEHRHEQRFAGDQPLAGLEELAHQPFTLGLGGTVAEDSVHLDAIVHEQKRTGFCHAGFLWVEGDFDELHLFAEDLIVDLVRFLSGAGA